MERYRLASTNESVLDTPIAVTIDESVVPFSVSTRSKYLEKPDGDHENDKSVQSDSKIAAPYTAYLQSLVRMLAAIDPERATQLTQRGLEVAEETYNTVFGAITFTQLHELTRKYAAYILRTTYQMHAADIDDGLQAGYTHLWERLRQEPNYLKDKQLAWIGKGIAYQALHAIRHDRVYQQHIETGEGQSSSGRSGSHSHESRHIDMLVDMHQAIAAVANQIVMNEKGKQANYQIWALYGLTMLHVSASEVSRLFKVREQSMQAAYTHVRQQLQAILPEYAPPTLSNRFGQRGREALPKQDIAAISQSNCNISDAVYEVVRAKIITTNSDTRQMDEIALEGIQHQISISAQARKYNIPQHQMQRAYKRVHLMIGAQHDPTVRTLRPERRVKFVFTLTQGNAAAVEQLALDFLKQPKSYEKLVALHAHISNLAISTTAKHFQIPTSTLRYYNQRIGKILNTPTQSAREL